MMRVGVSFRYSHNLDTNVLFREAKGLEARYHCGEQLRLRAHPLHAPDVQIPLEVLPVYTHPELYLQSKIRACRQPANANAPKKLTFFCLATSSRTSSTAE